MKSTAIYLAAFALGTLSFVAMTWAIGCFAFWNSNPIDQWSVAGRGTTGMIALFFGSLVLLGTHAAREG